MDALRVRAIHLYNRADECGLRSRFIALKGLDGDRVTVEFRNVSRSRLDALSNELKTVLSQYHGILSFPKDSVHAAKYVRSIVYELLKGGTEVSRELIIALLPISGASPRLDSLSAHFLTDLLERELEHREHINTRFLKDYSSILNDDVSIDCLSKFASRKDGGDGGKLVIAKHRVHYDTLVSERKLHLDFLDELLKALEPLSGFSMLAYGTLLGAYRSGEFLPADDDIDIIFYYPHIKDADEKECYKEEILEYLIGRGFSANIQPGCPHITVNSKVASVGVDIFLAWAAAPGKASVVMERLEYRDVNESVLIPLGEIQLYGRAYSCPANVEGFLKDRYGNGWSRSNPYHEWPWRLERRAYFNDMEVASHYDFRESQRKTRVSSARTQMVAWSQCVLKNQRPPSNSVPMLQQALEYNYDVVELDIRVCKGGGVVLSHDDVVENGDGDRIVISDSDLSTACSFKLGRFNGEDVYMSSLSHALPMLSGKQVLLDARFKPEDYKQLRACVNDVGFDPSMLIFCVYNVEQMLSLIKYFPESLLFWKFYTQAWEIDELALDQVRQYGVDGVMFMYPYFDEDVSESLYQIKKRELQSMCFIHGQAWTPPHSSGLRPDRLERGVDCYNSSLRKMVACGVEYVTTIECMSETFREIICGY